jgi:hypothetical protein
MNKALLWAGCCLILFVAFLWITYRPKPIRTKDLIESQQWADTRTEVVETQRSVTRNSAEAVTQPEQPSTSETVKPSPVKSPEPRPSPAMDLKNFASDEILALPLTEQKKFLSKNQLQDPEKFASFRNISQLSMIEDYLKGDFLGKLEGQEGEEWFLHLTLDGAIEEQHFQGEITVELQDKTRAPLSRSHLRGPLDDHIRVVEDGDRSSLLIQPTGPENMKLYQVFIGGNNKQQLVGNYYARNGEGKLQRRGSFVLKKGEL